MSSAYNAAEVSSGTTFGRSFIKIANRTGPRILPCGTPDVTGAQEDATPSAQLVDNDRSDSLRTMHTTVLIRHSV